MLSFFHYCNIYFYIKKYFHMAELIPGKVSVIKSNQWSEGSGHRVVSCSYQFKLLEEATQ